MSALPDWAVQKMIQNFGRGMAEDDVERIVRSVVESASFAFDRIATRGVEVLSESDYPHVRMRPALQIDGDQWCALYGENLQAGVAGFGKSPALAMADFDRAWLAALPAKEGGRHE